MPGSLGMVASSNYLRQGLLGWWRCNGDATDSSGQGNHGTATNVVLTADRFGNANQAYSFDGTSAYITTGKSLLSSLPALSLCGWVYLNGNQTARSGFFGQNDCLETVFSTAGSTLTAWTSSGNLAMPTPLSLSVWHHVVITLTTAGVFSLYVDNVFIKSVTGVTLPATAYNFNIGGGGISDPTSDFFTGCIDDVRLYNRPLSVGEIATLYNLTSDS